MKSFVRRAVLGVALIVAPLLSPPLVSQAEAQVSFFWTHDHHRTVVLKVDFRDAVAASAALNHRIKNLLIDTTANGGSNNLVDFYRDMSYRRLRLTVDIAVNPFSRNGWFRMPLAATSYSKANTVQSIQLIRDAIKAADSVVDYRNVDSVLVIINVEAKAIGCGFARGIRFGAEDKTKFNLEAQTADGVVIYRGAQVCEDTSLATIVHEFGHILGLPDLYRSNPTQRYMGAWDLMASSPGFTCSTTGSLVGLAGWSRMKLGFIPATQIVRVNGAETRSAVIGPLDSPSLPAGSKRLIRFDNPLNPRRYLIVEVRQPQGYDVSAPGTGVLLSEVDESIGDGAGTVRVLPALREALSKPMDGALFKAPGEPAPVIPRCDTSPGLSRWNGRHDGFVAGVGDRSWFPDISVTDKQGSTYTVQVKGRLSR